MTAGGTPDGEARGAVLAERVHRVGGRPLRVLEAGPRDAPAALLLHGLPGSAEDWLRLGPLLARRWRVLAIDRVGYGGSGGEPLPPADQAAVYAQLLEQIGGGPSLVLGHSYGSLPATALAVDHPSLVGALVLVAPVLHDGRRSPPGLDRLRELVGRPGVASVLRSTLLSGPARALLARTGDASSFAPDEPDRQHMEGVRDRTMRLEVIRTALAEGATMSDDAATLAASSALLAAAVLVVHGDGDRVVPAASGARTAEAIRGAELAAMGGGHMITISRAADLATRVEAFASRHGSLPAGRGECR